MEKNVHLLSLLSFRYEEENLVRLMSRKREKVSTILYRKFTQFYSRLQLKSVCNIASIIFLVIIRMSSSYQITVVLIF